MADVYDVVVIGAGPGEEHAAGRLADGGLRAVTAINDVGLLAGEADPVSGEMIGNFPQDHRS